jgi:hypothetical protein
VNTSILYGIEKFNRPGAVCGYVPISASQEAHIFHPT